MVDAFTPGDAACECKHDVGEMRDKATSWEKEWTRKKSEIFKISFLVLTTSLFL
jgi:hypothetical protein